MTHEEGLQLEAMANLFLAARYGDAMRLHTENIVDDRDEFMLAHRVVIYHKLTPRSSLRGGAVAIPIPLINPLDQILEKLPKIAADIAMRHDLHCIAEIPD